MRFAHDRRTVEAMHHYFAQDLLRQHEEDLARRARTARQLRALDGSRVEQRRLRRRALRARRTG